MAGVLSKAYFHDEAAAYAKLESIIWPEGPVCPHCGSMGRVYSMTANADKRIRVGLKKCGDCRKQFTVKVGTVFEASNVKLNLWFQAAYLMASSKKGISAHQLHRTLGVTYKTAWFMAHRIREAMKTMGLEPMGGEGETVEVDETFIGRKKGAPKKRAYHHKMKVLTLVDRRGEARSVVVNDLKPKTIVPILKANIAKETRVMTDEAGHYYHLLKDFAEHHFVRHSQDEYVLPGGIHTNTIEGYFSIFKRGMKGVYQHCSEKHLHRYLAEFDFRYNARESLGVNDGQRAEQALAGIVGKRLMYLDSRRASV